MQDLLVGIVATGWEPMNLVVQYIHIWLNGGNGNTPIVGGHWNIGKFQLPQVLVPLGRLYLLSSCQSVNPDIL